MENAEINYLNTREVTNTGATSTNEEVETGTKLVQDNIKKMIMMKKWFQMFQRTIKSPQEMKRTQNKNEIPKTNKYNRQNHKIWTTGHEAQLTSVKLIFLIDHETLSNRLFIKNLKKYLCISKHAFSI